LVNFADEQPTLLGQPSFDLSEGQVWIFSQGIFDLLSLPSFLALAAARHMRCCHFLPWPDGAVTWLNS
jgi:hypothetical protein